MTVNPVAFLGEVALLLALCVCAFTIAAAVAGARRGSRRLVFASINGAYATAALITLSSAVMWFLILSNDYSVKYVQRHSDASMPWYYRLTAFWGGLDGSIMWWVLLLALFSALAIFVNRERHRELIPWVTAVLFTVVAFFLILIIYEKRPFELFLIDAPRIGKGMNPLLQNPYMATHPPSLYLGFVSATVPFAFGLAALITGNLDDAWIQSVRRWTLVSWYFLTQGLVLGSLWAYEELGWGGYWGWDPVENAGLLPWLTSTAFLHSVLVQERRSMMKIWNVSLVIVTFLLTMIGTFMTRSGVVQSVHAFGQDTELAIIFLCFIGFVAIFSFGWVIYRLPLLRGRGGLDSWLSREFAFLLNNWILLSAAFFVLVATLFPTLSEWLKHERINVGPPFFTKWMSRLGLILIFLTGVGPLIAWRRATAANLRQQFTFPSLGALTTLALLQIPERTRGLTPSVVCFSLCAFTLVTIVQEFYRGTRVRQSHTKLDFFTSLIGLVARAKRRYGGYLVHIAVVMMFVGFAGDAYKREVDANLGKGKSVALGKYTVRFDGMTRVADAQKEQLIANVTVLVNGEEYARMAPAKWAFRHFPDEPPTTEVDIKKSFVQDLYIILNGFDDDGNMATIRVVINPLVNWIWLGFILLLIGAVIAYLPDRVYVAAGAKSALPSDKARDIAIWLAVFFGLSFAVAKPAHADGMEAAGAIDLHEARSDRERAVFDQLACLCGCLHSLNECGGECGPGVPRRKEVQAMLDGGKDDAAILDWEVAKYGQKVLRVPIDKGFNRLAWALPIIVLLGAAGGLVVVARRSRKSPPPVTPAGDKPVLSDDDVAWQDKLDDELDKLD